MIFALIVLWPYWRNSLGMQDDLLGSLPGSLMVARDECSWRRKIVRKAFGFRIMHFLLDVDLRKGCRMYPTASSAKLPSSHQFQSTFYLKKSVTLSERNHSFSCIFLPKTSTPRLRVLVYVVLRPKWNPDLFFGLNEETLGRRQKPRHNYETAQGCVVKKK